MRRLAISLLHIIRILYVSIKLTTSTITLFTISKQVAPKEKYLKIYISYSVNLVTQNKYRFPIVAVYIAWKIFFHDSKVRASSHTHATQWLIFAIEFLFQVLSDYNSDSLLYAYSKFNFCS